MAKALTARSVAQTRPDPKRRIEKADGLVTGLYLIVQPAGGKSWAVRYRYGGRPRKLTIGPYPALDLAKARKAAKEALEAVAKGGDPASQRKAAKKDARDGRDLFENVVAEFLERHAKNLKSCKEVERVFNHDVLPHWRGRRIQDITRRDVVHLLDGLTDRGVRTLANRVLSAVRKLFNWAISRDIIEVSPVNGVRAPVPEVSRDRVLNDDEIRLFWKATETLGYPFGPLFQLLLVTGQRLSEVAQLPSSELNLNARIWSLPKERAKNGRPHEVSLSDLAINIIGGLPRIAGSRGLLFTTNGETSVSGFSRAKRTLDLAMAADGEEIPHWTLHDLRRTLATGMQRLGVPPHVTEAVLNHRSGSIQGVSAVYQRHSYEAEKRAALDDWARFVTAIVEGKPDTVGLTIS